MKDGVWGNVKDWGLAEHSDGSAVYSIDPVCGRPVDEAKAAGKTKHGGVNYYFCSKTCLGIFEQAPGDYIGLSRWPSVREIDVNTATAESLRTIFHVDDDGLQHILRGRPYRNWTDFKLKNPGFSEPMLEGLKRAGVSISPPGLGRMV
jgi:YHS domain-containing protein